MTGGPLAGLRVIEAGTYFSAPFAAMMLSDLGAEVVKVEQPGKGDPFRSFARPTRGVSSMFVNVNRGKDSVALDLKDPAGRDALVDLVRDADIFIHNWRPGVAESLGLADEVLAAANPRLIRVAISGYGPTGPYASQPAFDALMQAQSGLAVYEEAGGAPRLKRTSLYDKVTSVFAAQSILAAVVARSTTGEGQLLELGMLDALAYFNYPDMFQDLTFTDDGDAAVAGDGTPSLLVPTADGHIVVQPMTGTQLKRVCVACDHPEWVDELKRCDPARLRAEFHRRLVGALVGEPTEHWVERFRRDDVPVAAALSLTDHLADAQVVHNDLYEIDEHPEPLGRVRRGRYPTRFTGTPTVPRTSVPPLDTDRAHDRTAR